VLCSWSDGEEGQLKDDNRDTSDEALHIRWLEERCRSAPVGGLISECNTERATCAHRALERQGWLRRTPMKMRRGIQRRTHWSKLAALHHDWERRASLKSARRAMRRLMMNVRAKTVHQLGLENSGVCKHDLAWAPNETKIFQGRTESWKRWRMGDFCWGMQRRATRAEKRATRAEKRALVGWVISITMTNGTSYALSAK
jgi:hypothetical protein